MTRILTALPVFNEKAHVQEVLHQVSQHTSDILVINDGSNDGTADELHRIENIAIIEHEVNLGYGAALRSAFNYAIEHKYEALITIDCDGQHQPDLISIISQQYEDNPDWDIISGSRYLDPELEISQAPQDRRQINFKITEQLNEQLGLSLTDSFCGFKLYKTSALAQLRITEAGYAMPLQLWIQAACLDLKITEFAVPLLYLDEKRSFGGSLDDSQIRLKHYQEIIQRELKILSQDCHRLPIFQNV